MNPAVPRVERPESRGTGWVLAQTVLLVGGVASGPLRSGDWHSPVGLGFGAVLFAAAGILGVTGGIQLGSNRTPFPAPRPGSVLVRHGVYAWCRHPLYASLMLAAVAWALLWQSRWAAAIALVQVPFFFAKSTVEERRLRRRFPDYDEYARQVKRFLPGVF